MLTNDLVDALAIEYRFVQRLRSHQQLAHVVGVVDPLVPRLTLARSEDPAIVEGAATSSRRSARYASSRDIHRVYVARKAYIFPLFRGLERRRSE